MSAWRHTSEVQKRYKIKKPDESTSKKLEQRERTFTASRSHRKTKLSYIWIILLDNIIAKNRIWIDSKIVDFCFFSGGCGKSWSFFSVFVAKRRMGHHFVLSNKIFGGCCWCFQGGKRDIIFLDSWEGASFFFLFLSFLDNHLIQLISFECENIDILDNFLLILLFRHVVLSKEVK